MNPCQLHGCSCRTLFLLPEAFFAHLPNFAIHIYACLVVLLYMPVDFQPGAAADAGDPPKSCSLVGRNRPCLVASGVSSVRFHIASRGQSDRILFDVI